MKNCSQRASTTSANNFGFVLFLVLCFGFLTLTISAQTTIVNYNFNDAATGTPCNPGTPTLASGVTSTFTTSTGTCAVPTSNNVTATAPPAFTANTVAGSAVSITNAVGTQYFQFQLSNVASYTNYMVFFQSFRSPTGPTNGILQYSTDGVTFTDFQTFTVNTTYTANNFDLSAISAIENQASVYFRIAVSGASGSSGTVRIDNFQIAATPTGSTAAGVNVSGNVLSVAGKGIWRASVMLNGGSLKSPVYATTDFDGNFNFADVPAGETYVLSVSVKGFKFDQTNIVVNLSEDFNQAHFIGTPKSRVSGLK